MRSQQNIFIRVLKGTWAFVGSARRFTFNLLFLFIVVGLLVAVFGNDEPEIADKTALVIKPRGQLVEQLTAKTFNELLDEATGDAVEETLLKDVVDAIHAAKDDERVQVLVLDLSSFGGARLTKLQDLAEAIQEFKTSGKKVVA